MSMQVSNINAKRILLSPLNWGMGHVARCIPLIRRLEDQGNVIIVAGTEEQLSVFQSYFPRISTVVHHGYPFRFGGKGHFATDMFRSSVALYKRLKLEVEEVEKLVDRLQLDVVISDHRYGFRSKKVPSVFVTHQLQLPLSWCQLPVQWLHRSLIRRFDAIWIVDEAPGKFAGALSNCRGFDNATYIGRLSRFENAVESLVKDIEAVVILSGPREYATHLLDYYAKTMAHFPGVIYVGDECLREQAVDGGLHFVSNADWLLCDDIILRAKKIFSACGYSTLMDLTVLRVPFSVMPTPGQAEQLYLHKWWSHMASTH
jgi:hypothetical protein